ncbi:TPA_asm: hypothetical protein GGA58_00655 [Listeria monocytogenes]|nr:hypothetical protein Y255_08145 [Listeria monocytogenes]EAE5862544.1 hypothetical protein [Listeria monocytogenes]EAF1641701.1 hypothetical protein [Listeria monocytogenes]EAF6250396.1 hypothetical protein [Listeria monocytogenes]EAG5528493.1 hypothetical protein [Listeria monocytogenes]
MAAFIPGASPPLVKIAIRFILLTTSDNDIVFHHMCLFYMKKGQMKSFNRALFLTASSTKPQFKNRSIPIYPKNGFIA